jgi:hypothetical protein
VPRVHRDRAAELGDDQHGRVLPNGPELDFQRLHARVEAAQARREVALARALIRMRVPTADVDRGDARSVRALQEARGRRHDRRDLHAGARAAHAVAPRGRIAGDVARVERLDQSVGEPGVRVSYMRRTRATSPVGVRSFEAPT